MILVTGATGSNSSEIVKLLAAKNVPVRAMVRDFHSERLRQRSRASNIALPNVELVEADFDQSKTLLTALEGVERAFNWCTNSSERAEAQQLAFVEAAKQSGVAYLVKLSQFPANANSPVRFLRYHAAVEAAS